MKLNVRCRNTKPSFKKKKGKNLQDLEVGKEFLQLTPKTQCIKEKN